MKRSVAVMVILLAGACSALSQKSLYLDQIKKSVDRGWQEYPAQIEQWKKNYQPSVLWGYNPPGGPAYLAGALGFLYEETKDISCAKKAAEILASYGDLRNSYPKDYARTRAEYVNGIPAISNFFFMPPFIRAYLRIKDCGVLDQNTRKNIEENVAGSADFIFYFPEWGTHNRAMLRAEALMYAALAMPNHPHAEKWNHMAQILGDDNLKQWEIEDATVYHPVWLTALYSYADAAGRKELFDSPLTKYYPQYYQKLIGPQGTIPEFGDARWSSGWDGLRWVAIFEKAAAVYKDPQLKWAAQSVLESFNKRGGVVGVGEAYYLADAYRWTDETVKPQKPVSLSQEVLDDLVGKKIVFRNGWDPTSTYMLLNYRDEGDGGLLYRDFLRQTISVEEEKMHHGHADENSIPLLMSEGSVLLHDADYRSDLPSGPYGAWRQDYFHNRLIARPGKRDSRQGLLEFVQNSGSYRAVRTQKIDFLNLKEVDMSRTRLVDQDLGYQSDRVITYIKEEGWFVVVDAIKILRSGYFTFANLWHAQTILEKGKDYLDIVTDSIQGQKFPSSRSLLLVFPEAYQKTLGVEPISRSTQKENAVFQTVSSQYKAGDTELFVTVLIPHTRGEKLDGLKSRVKLIDVSAPYKAVGLEIKRGGRSSYLCVKVDLDMDIARENVRPRYLYTLGKVGYGDIETDASYLFATVNNGRVAYSASNVLKVLYKNKPMFEALANSHPLQLDGTTERIGYVKWRYWEDTVEYK
ncbi:MAG: hypothetical protein NTU47_00485 [Ignavibacteriales bacterium]|nr:hypothetical protein [Ignavibacteriales bacterium]